VRVRRAGSDLIKITATGGVLSQEVRGLDMVCASLAEYGDRVAGGVSIVGISPFRTFDGKTHP
jgi:hypothetical protein